MSTFIIRGYLPFLCSVLCYSKISTNARERGKVSKIFKYKNDYLLESYKTLNEAGIKNNIIPQVLGRHINTGKEYKGYYWYKKECDLI